MAIIHITIKSRLRYVLFALSFLLFAFGLKAQTYVSAPMTGTPAAGSYYSNTSITLSPNFSFTAASGSSLTLYIGNDCIPQTIALSASQNYILTSTPRVGGFKNAGTGINTGDFAGRSTCELMQTVQYFDGLGRPLQTVQIKGSPLDKDIVQPVAYDAYGREVQKYLPYTATTADGSYKGGAITDQGSFYTSPPSGSGVTAVASPFALSVFEPSPLNRVTEQGAPGAAWQPVPNSTTGHTVKITYGTNGTNEVLIWNVNSNGNGASFTTTYAAGLLYKTVTTDENGNNTREYKDKKGNVVCKVAEVTGDTYYTYYVYDDFNNLQYVIPPMVTYPTSFVEADAVFTNLMYGYHYDARNRLIQKKIPGKGWEYLVYNKLDQPVLSQDANQRLTNQWTVTKYDALGRVIMTGLWNAGSAIAQSTLQGSIYGLAQWDSRDNTNNTTTYPTGYVLSSYPTLSKILTVNYYDAYTNIPGIPAAFVVTGNSTMTKGLLTATQTAVLNTITNTTPDMLWTAHYYDDLGRNTKTFQQHYLGGVLNANNYDVVTSTYNFTNQLTTATRQHFTSASTTVAKVTVSNRYIYDHMGRKLKTWEQIQNGALAADTRTLVSLTDYNETGQLWKKHLHSTDSATFKQDITYAYNERGWLKTSSAQLFEEMLQYNTATVQNGLTPVARYNGDIASQSWGTLVAPDTKTYIYKYDQLNRLTEGTASNLYSEQGITYDKMGNITALKRYTGSATATDDLTYNYLSGANITNQLQSITDGTTSDVGQKHGTFTYAFDANGNMITDNSKGITGTTGITYNLLNLPQAISAKSTTYTYDAAGQKLRRVIGTATTDYISGIQYDASTSAISFIQTEEGRALTNTATGYNYEYSLTDHLGNSRVNFDTGTGVARQVQSDDYYPFGMEISNSFLSPKNEYLYNKKELQENLGLYDYGARFYDPVIARWTTVDPKAELDRRWTPYNYASCDPINRFDPDGNKDQPFNKKKDKPITIKPGTATPIKWLIPPNGESLKGALATADSKDCYNCHSFAWHNGKGDAKSNAEEVKAGIPKWDDHPEKDVKAEGVKQLGKDEKNVVGDKVIYFVDTNHDGKWEDGENIIHSANVVKVDKDGNTTVVEGKMGQNGISDNHPNAPGYYEDDGNSNSTTRAYFRVEKPKKEKKKK